MSLEELGRIAMHGADGSMMHLSDIGNFVSKAVEQPIYHKNLKPVVYVFAEMAGRSPVDAIFGLKGRVNEEDGYMLPEGVTTYWQGEGEWQITVDVFRDLGLAFAIAMLGIYIILVFEIKSFRMPLVIMAAIPLTAIGIMPGFAVLNFIAAGESGGR
ncbi:MAG: efflux RND transporter permease subunit [Planctomycetota bacterium]|nr:efflux RND transporter permease subunit [Planctomycetota bacterium]